MAFFFQASESIGATPIGTVDDTQRHALGTIFPAQDPLLGAGEFIYLKGVASTVAGNIVDYDPLAGTTTRSPATTGTGPVAVAMASTVASKFGWYQIAGVAVVTAPAVAATGDCYMSAVATLDESVVANEGIIGAKFITITNGGTPAAGATNAYALINRPAHGVTTP